MHVGIVGGGILGITFGYFLTRQGVKVTIFEASILTTDGHLQKLFDDLGIQDQYRSREAKTAFYHQGHLYPMTTLKEFLTFPPLNVIDRFRLGLTIVNARLVRDILLAGHILVS